MNHSPDHVAYHLAGQAGPEGTVPSGENAIGTTDASREGETQRARAKAKALNIPFVDPLNARIEPAAISLVNREMAFQLQALAVRVVEGVLLVAMASPENPMAVRTLELLTSCKVRPAAAPRDALAMVLKKIYQAGAASSPAVSVKGERCGDKHAGPQPAPGEAGKGATTISIISNKGGVGKTHFAVNLACALARKSRVLLIDADLGNADVSNKLALFPDQHLLDFLEKDRRMDELIVGTRFGFDLICGTYGEFKLANMNHAQKTRFISHFKKVSERYDFAVFDLGAGIARTVLDFALGADRTVIVTTPQDLISGYACAKAAFCRFKEIEERLEERFPQYTPQWSFSPLFVMNQVLNAEQGFKLFHHIARTANEKINAGESRFRIEPEYLGAIDYDKEGVRNSEQKKTPLLISAPYLKTAQSIAHMASRFVRPDQTFDPRMRFKHPFRRMMALLTQKL